VVKAVQEGVRHDAAGPVEAMPLALHLAGRCRCGTGKPGRNGVCGRPRL
jgi:hypothetical protein